MSREAMGWRLVNLGVSPSSGRRGSDDSARSDVADPGGEQLFAGEAMVMLATEGRGASNAKAKRELGWILRYPSWREGFAEAYAKPAASPAAPIRTPRTVEEPGDENALHAARR